MSERQTMLPCQNEAAEAYELLREDVARLAHAGPLAADDILSLAFRRLTSERPAYFARIIDEAGGDLVGRQASDPATLRLLFGSLIGMSPVSGLPKA